MGAIEIQVFVSLVVILGAAFVALICDFLKGSNEQLREANIVMRVRQDERDKRDDLVEKVQQQTIEVVAKVQGALAARPVAPAVPAAQPAPWTQQPTAAPLMTPVSDARELFERAQSERSARGRRTGRRVEEKPTAPLKSEPVAGWAQDIVIRKHQEAEPLEAAAAEIAPAEATQVPVPAAPVAMPAPIAQSSNYEFAATDAPADLSAPAPGLEHSETFVPLASTASLTLVPSGASPVFVVPSYSNLTEMEDHGMAGTPPQTTQEADRSPAMVDAQQTLQSQAVSVPVAISTFGVEANPLEPEAAIPHMAESTAACRLAEGSTVALATANPAAMAASVVELTSNAVSAQAESNFPALNLHSEVPEFEIVPPAIEEFSGNQESSEVFEAPLAEGPFAETVSTEQAPAGVAEITEEPVVVFEAPIAEAVVAEEAPAEAAEVVEGPVAVASEAPVAEPVATETVVIDDTLSEAVASSSSESVEAVVQELPMVESMDAPISTPDYSLLDDMPVYAEIPTLPRVEAMPEPVAVAPVEATPASLFEPTVVEGAPDEEIQVVRIRVLRDDDVLPGSEFADTLISLDELSSLSSTSAHAEAIAVAQSLVAEVAADVEPEQVAEPESIIARMLAEAQPELFVEAEPVNAEMPSEAQPEEVAEPGSIVARMLAEVEPEPVIEAEPVVVAMQAEVEPEPVVDAEPVVAEMLGEAQPEPVIEAGPVTAEMLDEARPEPFAEFASSLETSEEPSIWLTGAEPSTWDLHPEPVVTEAEPIPDEPMFAEASALALAASSEPFSYRPTIPDPVAETAAPVIPQSEMRPKVVEMRTAAPHRIEQEAPSAPTLALPGGFHEPNALARLLEDESTFAGLVIAVSVVDYVRLMADQGKPAIEQIMASVTRLIMSLTREQDFACRIAEDEFILIFGSETGAAAKRRTQLVSERLWDYQLRSLGSVSIIFSWGAAESQLQPIVHAVENAREQMLETRRNRRNLTGVSRRFGRQVANS